MNERTALLIFLLVGALLRAPMAARACTGGMPPGPNPQASDLPGAIKVSKDYLKNGLSELDRARKTKGRTGTSTLKAGGATRLDDIVAARDSGSVAFPLRAVRTEGRLELDGSGLSVSPNCASHLYVHESRICCAPHGDKGRAFLVASFSREEPEAGTGRTAIFLDYEQDRVSIRSESGQAGAQRRDVLEIH